MELHIFDDKEMLSDAMALWITELIADTLKTQEFFYWALSGGETPKLLYQKLGAKYRDAINWERIHIFWGDERVVAFEDDRNNAKMAYDLLLSRVNIPPDHVHMMRTDLEPHFSVDKYRGILYKFFNSTEQSFDLVLLGLGDDGHTLSLFPGSPVNEDSSHWVNSVYNEKQEMYRITLMPAIVNKSGKIAFMVDGPEKAKILQEVLEGKYKPAQLPAQLIRPVNGQIHWFIDKDAAGKLHAL